MIKIISASNRDGNLTAFFAKKCKEIVESKGLEVELFYLSDLPTSISLDSIYQFENSDFTVFSNQIISPAEKFLFVVPEYNGSIPGILKLFIDAIEPKKFRGKKAALIGVAAGRAGNIRGMDHLSDILNHLEVNVMPQKLPISQLYGLIDKEEVVDRDTLSSIDKQLQLLIDF